MKIDSHIHFWLYNAEKDAWISDDMKVIQRNFLPNDISWTLKDNGIDGLVAVQADQSLAETEFLTELADVYKVIKAVVGWVDLRSGDVDRQLDTFSKYPIVKGFRHIVEAEQDADFLTRPEFQRGIEALTKRNYTYDLLVSKAQYESTLECVSKNPNQQFILDHIAKPDIVNREFDEWSDFISKIAAFPNVYCKISGLVTEADWKNWLITDFEKYIKHAIESFGKKRICFGSDWPVSLLGATYEQVIKIIDAHLSDFSEAERTDFWGLNILRFYGIK